MYVFEAEHDMGPSFESMAPVWAAPPQLILGWRLQQSGRFWTIIHPSGNKKIDLLRVRSRRRLVALTEVATRQKSHVDVSTLLLALEHAVQRAFNMSLPHMLAWGLMDWEWPALDSDSGFEDDGEHEYELEYETDKDKDKDKDKESEESEGSSDSSGKSEHGDRRIAIPPAHAQENSSKNPTVVSETISLGAPKI